MTPNRPKTVAIVPARGGSKGILRKNLVNLNGKPLIAYAIEAGLTCKEVDRVIVSTDDPEIAKVALKYGAEVPFRRPQELAQDDTPDRPVFLHLIEWLKETQGYNFEYLVNLRCTTPLKRVEHVQEAIRIIRSEDCDSVRAASKINAKYHPYWTFKTDEYGYAETFIKDINMTKYHQRQCLPIAYSINALVDVMKTDIIRKYEYPYGKRIKFLEIDPVYALDIDSEIDLMICEKIMENLDELV
jgi:CMP-N-acetylneuraminic acid synthetase|tara:strand:+ start:2074 stop:2802 length:729 start_codon:yes stop_codon:yes gene_type:complete